MKIQLWPEVVLGSPSSSSEGVVVLTRPPRAELCPVLACSSHASGHVSWILILP